MSKTAEAFRTISEVASELDVPKHVLRFWEARFPQIRPMKRGGGRRYYRPEDLALLRGICHLLHAEGYTIKASELGKTKTITQVIAISCLLLSIRHPVLAQPAIWATWGVVIFAMLSALDYFRKFWRKVNSEIKLRRRRELLLLERQKKRLARRSRPVSSIRVMGWGAPSCEGGTSPPLSAGTPPVQVGLQQECRGDSVDGEPPLVTPHAARNQ